MSRVVLLVPRFPKLSETFILNKFLGLLERGWDVHVVCWESRMADLQQVQEAINPNGVRRRVHVTWFQSPRWLALLLLPLALLRCLIFSPAVTLKYLQRGWERFGFDVFRRLYLDAEVLLLHPNLIHIEFGALAPERMYLKNLLDSKVLVSFRGYDLNFVRLDHPDHYQVVWDQADILHLLGNDLWQRAQQRGCPAEKAHVLIPPAIDATFFAPLDRAAAQEDAGTLARPLRILSVGRLEWKKGYEFTFESIRLLVAQGIACEYRVIGDGEYYESLTFARHQMGLQETIQLLGAQPPEEVRLQMSWADVFLHGAVSEGFCNSVIEAQAMSVPVVCSDADGLSENVQHGETGFVTPRRNPQAMADALARLARDKTLRDHMGIAGRARVLQHFQLDRQINEFEKLYKGLLEGRAYS